jgi:hypothetical protein
MKANTFCADLCLSVCFSLQPRFGTIPCMRV